MKKEPRRALRVRRELYEAKNTRRRNSVDRSGEGAHSKQINYKDSKIGLKLPIPISEISDYDLSAPYISESSEEIL